MASKNNLAPICFVAGKSGGHIIPCLTIAKTEFKKSSVLFFSTNTPLDKKLLSSNSMVTQHIILPFGKSSNIKLAPFLLFNFISSFLKSVFWLLKTKPQKVISTGGLVALPVCCSAWFLRIPIELFELNAVPGKAINFLAPFATTIFVCFESTKKYFSPKKCHFKPYPVRFSKPIISQKNALRKLNFDTDKKTLLILGGSQGSVFINTMMREWIKNYNKKNIQIIHQTGLHETNTLKSFYANQNISSLIFSYQEQMDLYYSAADIIICRAGAGTLFETIFFGKKGITIPLETPSTNHQKINAQVLEIQYPKQIVELKQNNKVITKLNDILKDI